MSSNLVLLLPGVKSVILGMPWGHLTVLQKFSQRGFGEFWDSLKVGKSVASKLEDLVTAIIRAQLAFIILILPYEPYATIVLLYSLLENAPILPRFRVEPMASLCPGAGAITPHQEGLKRLTFP